ncbi:hypothetical protein AK812_SmicGene19870 [Symbiodinium microadriaticum]|uniref:Uncharacterized protein n=1 Tax=Symbiodinium microadriaticum TaxID=2951 RepID=A0A1Q9DRL0_SYMMI|nr:hypothetical protein AK812_SmicGene19870 [Symbiodinium microadriaticum]
MAARQVNCSDGPANRKKQHAAACIRTRAKPGVSQPSAQNQKAQRRLHASASTSPQRSSVLQPYPDQSTMTVHSGAHLRQAGAGTAGKREEGTASPRSRLRDWLTQRIQTVQLEIAQFQHARLQRSSSVKPSDKKPKAYRTGSFSPSRTQPVQPRSARIPLGSATALCKAAGSRPPARQNAAGHANSALPEAAVQKTGDQACAPKWMDLPKSPAAVPRTLEAPRKFLGERLRCVHHAACRIQRAWRISHWRRSFVDFSRHQVGWLGSLSWLRRHHFLYGNELADSEDVRWWLKQRQDAALDYQVDPWGFHRLQEHLSHTWNRPIRKSPRSRSTASAGGPAMPSAAKGAATARPSQAIASFVRDRAGSASLMPLSPLQSSSQVLRREAREVAAASCASAGNLQGGSGPALKANNLTRQSQLSLSSDQQMRRCGSGPTVSRPHDRISSHTLPRSGSGTVFYERRA